MYWYFAFLLTVCKGEREHKLGKDHSQIKRKRTKTTGDIASYVSIPGRPHLGETGNVRVEKCFKNICYEQATPQEQNDTLVSGVGYHGSRRAICVSLYAIV